MGLSQQPNLVTVMRRALSCLVCRGQLFFDREVKMNTSGMEFFNLGWANQSAIGLICAHCGYVHEFMGNTVELWLADRGYPPDATAVPGGSAGAG